MEVVGDPQRLEPGLLGKLRLADKLGLPVLLGGQEVPELWHCSFLTRRPRAKPVWRRSAPGPSYTLVNLCFAGAGLAASFRPPPVLPC